MGWPDRGQRSARAWPRSRRVTEVYSERSSLRLPRRTPRPQTGQRKVCPTPEHSMGFMFAFKSHGIPMWRDVTAEQPGPGRLINHSKCHSNVSIISDC